MCEIDQASGQSREIARIAKLLKIRPAPEGRFIAVVVRSDDRENLRDILLVDRQTGEVTDLVRRPGEDFAPTWSPDGRSIAFRTDRGANDWAGSPSISVVDAATGAIREYPHFPSGSDIRWSADGTSLLFASAIGVQRRIYQLALESGEFRPSSPQGIAITDFVERGRHVYAIGQTRQRPDEIWEFPAAEKTSSPRLLTDFNAHVATRPAGDLRPIEWVASDGRTIEGLLLVPTGAEPPYPTVVYLHGGPGEVFTEAYFPQFGSQPFPSQTAPYPIHVMAGRGLAIFMPNPRGSLGHGLDFQQAIQLDWGGQDCDDILAGVGKLVADGVADPKRMGIMGWSYGGYLTNWLVTQTDAFVAASSGAGISDIEALIRDSLQSRYLNNFFPEDNPSSQRIAALRSPLNSARTIRTPVMFQHGGQDDSIPSSQPIALSAAMPTEAAARSRAMIYPGEGHLIMTPSSQRHVMQSNVDWFSHWLVDGEAGRTSGGFDDQDTRRCASTRTQPKEGN